MIDPAHLDGNFVLVTGAGTGIGRAIAMRLLDAGARVMLTGRRREPLEAVAATSNRALAHPSDLSDDSQLAEVCDIVEREFGKLDVLVHNAALYERGHLADAHVTDFDALFRVNVRAPFVLTQRLLPLLRIRHGQIVFVNSTAVGAKSASLSQYAATKQALQGLADSLRNEVNRDGIRVLSAYVGRTATPLQQRIFSAEGRDYKPERLLQPSDVAIAIVHALDMPPSAEITDLTIRPMMPS